MVDEVELFEVQIEKSVMTLGWIHTHPQFVSPTRIINGLLTGFVFVLGGRAQPARLLAAAARGNCYCLLADR